MTGSYHLTSSPLLCTVPWEVSKGLGASLELRWLVQWLSGCTGGRYHSNGTGTCNIKHRLTCWSPKQVTYIYTHIYTYIYIYIFFFFIKSPVIRTTDLLKPLCWDNGIGVCLWGSNNVQGHLCWRTAFHIRDIQCLVRTGFINYHFSLAGWIIKTCM